MIRAWAIAIALGLGACAGPSAGNPTPVEAASRRVDRAIADGLEATHRVSDYSTRARYNPAACDCPAWEVWIDGAWTRCALIADRGIQEDAVERFLEGDGVSVGTSFSVVVSLTRDVASGVDGWNYPVLEVSDMWAE